MRRSGPARAGDVEGEGRASSPPSEGNTQNSEGEGTPVAGVGVQNLGTEDRTELSDEALTENPQNTPITPGHTNDDRLSWRDFDTRHRDDIIQINKIRRKIKRIEKNSGKELSPEEQQLIVNRNRERNLSAIDKTTNDLLKRYDKLLEESSLSIRAKRVSAKVGMIVGSVGVSTGLRMALHSAGGLPGSFAGTITGAVIGGVVGGIRAHQVEKSKYLGIDGLIKEYETLKNGPTQNEDNRKYALTFLHKAIETKTFQGSAGDILRLAVFYKKELGSNIREADLERVLGELTCGTDESDDPQKQSVSDYRKAMQEACYASMWKGVGWGALRGAGIGAASDLVTWFTHGIRFGHFQDEYMKSHTGWGNEFHLKYDPTTASASDIVPDPHFNTLNDGVGLNLPATSYGNVLSHSIEEGIRTGQLEVPRTYLDQMAQEGVSKQDAIAQFIYNFNFAQPPHVGDWWSHGMEIPLNKFGVQEMMNETVRADHVDYQRFADILKGAGRFMDEQYPQILASEAAVEATKAAAEPIAESISHGGAIGYLADQAATSYANKLTEEGNHKKSGTTPVTGEGEQSRQTSIEQPATRTEAATEEAETATAAAAAATAAAAAAAAEEPSPASEPIVEEPEGTIDWPELFNSNRDTFERRMNKYLQIPAREWETLDSEQRDNFVGLFTFINNYNQLGLRFKIRLRQGRDVFKLLELPTANSPVIRIGNDAEERVINFASGDALLRVALQSRDPQDIDSPDELGMQEVSDDRTGELRYDFINFLFREARVWGGEVGIKIWRKWDDKGKATPLFRGDDIKQSPPEVIGFDSEARKLRIVKADGEVEEMPEANFRNIYGFKIYHWARGGTDDQYS